ncbi:MAG: ABC transporter substrate-binding protein [bacterium]|nr:ABC transporter substrate-binding protein [bacterium]
MPSQWKAGMNPAPTLVLTKEGSGDFKTADKSANYKKGVMSFGKKMVQSGRSPLWAALLFCLFGFFLAPRPAFPGEIAVLLSDDTEAYKTVLSNFRKNLPREKISEFNMKGDLEIGKKIIAQIKVLTPSVLLTVGAKASEIAAKQAGGIPQVYCMVFNPFELGLQNDNQTGVLMVASPDSQFAAFKNILPGLKRLGVIFNPQKTVPLVDAAKAALPRNDLEIVERHVSSSGEIAQNLKEIIPLVGAIWLIPDTTVVSRDTFSYLLQNTVDQKVPIFAFSEGLVKSGALASFSPDYSEIGKEAARLADKISSGASPKNLPPVYPRGDLYLNLNTAQTLGIKISPDIIRKAEKIY